MRILHRVKNKLRRLKASLTRNAPSPPAPPLEPIGRVSYSQCAEDLILDFVCTQLLKVSNPRYLEIGSHSPYVLNNTYYFYQRGGSGVCIEPNPNLLEKFREARPRDICLNVGVGIGDEKDLDFYIMTSDTLSTFSKEEVEKISATGEHKIEKIIQVPVLRTQTILKRYFPERAPHIVSLDVEGLDYEIMKNWDFDQCRPDIFCIETLAYRPDRKEEKIDKIFELMKERGYLCYADTYINSIFIDNEVWAAYRNGTKSV